MKRHILSISLLLATTNISTLCFAGGGSGGDATELTQLMNNAELVASVEQQATMISNQMQQLQNQVQNTQTVPKHVWSDTKSLLQQLQQVVQQGNALSYAGSNVDSRFQQLYPGYTPTQNFSASYQDWSRSTMDSIRGALGGANLQADQFTTEDNLMKQLETLAGTNSGQMQAIQTGNMIAAEQVQQLRKLRQLQMAQMQAQNSFMATTQQKTMAEQANTDRLFNTIPEPGQHTQYQYFRGGSK